MIFAKVFVTICGIKVSLSGENYHQIFKNTVVVSNHISWLDIFVIHSTGIPGIFIAKHEIRKWPFLGRLIANARTIFIDRANRRSLLEVLKKSRNLLLKGNVIVFFPEGTTGDGMKILPFRTSLFSLFIDSPGSKLLPMVIQYKKNGVKVTEPAYVGKMTLMDSIIKVLSSKNIEAYVEVLTPIFKLDKGKATNKSKLKREIADTVRLNMEKKIQM